MRREEKTVCLCVCVGVWCVVCGVHTMRHEMHISCSLALPIFSRGCIFSLSRSLPAGCHRVRLPGFFAALVIEKNVFAWRTVTEVSSISVLLLRPRHPVPCLGEGIRVAALSACVFDLASPYYPSEKFWADDRVGLTHGGGDRPSSSHWNIHIIVDLPA